MTVSYGTLVLDEADSGGRLIVRGSVTVTLSQRVPDAGDDLIFGQAPVTGVFRAGGPPSVQLPFNDTFGPQGDSGPGTTYTITYNGVPGSPAPWSFYLLSTNGDTQRLSAIASTPAAQPGQMYVPLPDTPPADDTKVLGLSSSSPLVTEWVDSGGGGGGSGTVTSVSVATANGFAGTVANATTTPAITVKTGVTGLLKGNGTAVSAASAGTDYLAPGALPGGTTATTQTAADDSTKVATTAYADGAVATETSRAETAEALLASKASPALTGNPTAPTQSAGNNSTRLATTAYADAAVGVETSRAETAEALKLAKAGDTMTGFLAPKVVTLTDGSSVALDASTGNSFTWALGGSSHTLAAPSNPVDGQAIKIRIKYSGSYTPLFNSVFDFAASGAPSWTATSGKTDICGFEYDGALNSAAGAWAYLGSVLGLTS